MILQLELFLSLLLYQRNSSPLKFLITISYAFYNPSFRFYEFDSETNQLVNYYQYRLDLEKWNSNTEGPIEWDLVYNFLEVETAIKLFLNCLGI